MGLGFKRIPEKDDEIDGTFYDSGTDLKIPAQRPAVVRAYRQPCLFAD
jgi:hypothetical protein